MARVFVYSASVPRFDQQSGDRRFAELLRLMARSHQVDLCVRLDEADPSNPPAATWTEKYRRFLAEGGVRLVSAGWRHVERALLREVYDFGFFEFYFNAAEALPLFRRLQPQARVLVDSVDVHYLREQAAADLGVLPPEQAEETRRRELGVYRAADAVVAVTDEDRTFLEREAGLPPVAIIPNIIATRTRSAEPRQHELLFVGGFQHLPNLDGLRWFVGGPWPRIREAVPEATLTVIGSNAPPDVAAMAALPGIRMLGFVPDTNPYLDQAAVSVAPLRYGAGMKGKVTEAMACGVPVVTTAVGVQGLRAVPGEQVLVADDLEGFARAVVALLRDPAWARRVGLSGQQFITGVCGPEVVARLAEEALAVARTRPRPPARQRVWDRVRFEAVRAFCLPYWGPRQLFRRYLKVPLRALRDRFVSRRPG